MPTEKEIPISRIYHCCITASKQSWPATAFLISTATMAATDQQMALSRPNRVAATTHMSKTARQIVPAFLQKLYELGGV